jgi:GNAT superfamily N-acetyltransferase
VSGYRFCRTDDIELLVEALNRCWAPYVPDEPPMTPAAFKRSIRDLQVWCSSCMVAFSGADPIGVLIGAKRASETLIHRIAVHPDHRRQGHARHLLESMASKLAILGPPRIVAEVPEALDAARGLFSASGYVEEAVLTDYVLRREDEQAVVQTRPALSERGNAARVEGFVMPITIDDLAANGLLEPPPRQASQVCWERSVETLTARKDELQGFAVAADEGIEGYLLYRLLDQGAEIAAFRSLIDDGGARLADLLSLVLARGLERAWFPKVHPAEIPAAWLEALGFRPAGAHRLYAATARPG